MAKEILAGLAGAESDRLFEENFSPDLTELSLGENGFGLERWGEE